MKSKTKTAKSSKTHSLRDLKLKKGNVKGGSRTHVLNKIKTSF